jgi:hypothetical protein
MSGFSSDNPTMAPPPAAQIAPPWEDESRPIFDRWKDTVIAVFTGPTAFFDAMRQEGGIGAPLMFAIIGGWVGIAASQVWNYIGSSLLHIAMFQRASLSRFAPMMGGSFSGMLCAIVLAPVYMAIGLFIGAGIVHLCLMLVGGAKRPFETTFRVVAYTSGSITLLNVVPLCGGMVGGIWALVVEVIGLSRAHQITTGKALVAVLIPVAAACLCVIGLSVTMAGLFAAAVHGGR